MRMKILVLTKVDTKNRALLAQLDRVPGYEPGGRRFESSRARHYFGFSSYMNLNPDIDKSLIET